jgi:branched-chain amino acid transport system permease protein
MRMVIYAAVLIALMILRPEGLFGERELFRKAKSKKTTPAKDDLEKAALPVAEPAKTEVK